MVTGHGHCVLLEKVWSIGDIRDDSCFADLNETSDQQYDALLMSNVVPMYPEFKSKLEQNPQLWVETGKIRPTDGQTLNMKPHKNVGRLEKVVPAGGAACMMFLLSCCRDLGLLPDNPVKEICQHVPRS